MTRPPQPEPSGVVAATAMFVEVLVVGIGFLTGLGILAAAIAGADNTRRLAPAAGTPLAAGAALACAYALGILIDRAADTVLAAVRRRLRSQSFPTTAAYAQARLKLAEIPALAARADYARSRLRICRGWMLNSILFTLATDLALWRYPVEHRPLLLATATVLGALAAVGFYLSWHTITATGYRKLAAQTTPAVTHTVPSQPPAPAPQTP
ncbi:hypothetical protein B046DRAFT_06137 [Streptomyces sp. LamerLS-316]|uniref:Integral membrane protein n=1 Tax=Streptomyces violaceus TaxID=1936 RepID=A0ABZ1NIZ4_STRVL|nr:MULTISPECIES: hypothetical protein [Streptomyces]MYQ39886.1 hypothetical protein [Streptomyces sp. SID4921]MYQ40679.1 hypothetical protein [Streptomyces sp. SID4921]SCK04807.1 hypothetical protein B046DRAFT_00002 [Streptomyces sp. LamerLS-316]SCK19143.1 hypothetical protein B046DRAFT_06137 [Streptomyces sp. LamerLS-316]